MEECQVEGCKVEECGFTNLTNDDVENENDRYLHY